MAANPLLDAFRALPATSDPLRLSFQVRQARYQLRRRYAWAIPTDEAISLLLACSPLVEIGAGTGYWASLVAAAGGEIRAFDNAPPYLRPNRWCDDTLFHPVAEGGVEMAAFHSDHSLFLCWPPLGSFAADLLDHYRGNQLLYVGERWEGWNADQRSPT